MDIPACSWTNAFIHCNKKVAAYPWKGKTSQQLQNEFSQFKGKSTAVAIVTGKVSGIFSVDIDDESEYEKFVEKHNLKDFIKYTYCDKTRKGFHAYFKLPESLSELGNSVSKIHEKIDIRANGGYIITAPSIIYDEYEKRCGNVEPMNNLKAVYPENALIDLLLQTMNPDPITRITKKSDDLLELIKIERFDTREKWLQLGTAMKSAGYTSIQFCDYSSKSPKHEPCTCEKVWDSLKELKIGERTLKFWAKQDDPIGYSKYKSDQRKNCVDILEVIQTTSPGKFDYSDKYRFINFMHEFSNKQYESFEEMDYAISSKISKVIAFISNSNSYIMKYDGYYVMTTSLGANDFVMYYNDSEGNRRKMTLLKFMREKICLSFAQVDCLIKGPDPEELIFNVFPGYKAKIIENPNMEIVNKLCNFVYEIWSSEDGDLYHYLMSWIASIFQKPGINRTALVGVSEQGAGKNTFSDLLTLMLGHNLVSENIGVSGVIQKHNTSIEGKRLNIINEMSSTKEEFRSAFDKIKAYITDATITIEPKGVKSYKISNIGNYMLFTNHRDSIIVEKSDRRYQIIELSPKRRGDFQYFDDLRATCYNDEGRDSFYTYLMNYKCCNLSNIVSTAIKLELMENSKNSCEKFIDYVIEAGNNISHQLYVDRECSPNKYGASHIYKKYVEFCKDQGEKNIWTNTKFGSALSKHFEKTKTKEGLFYNLTKS